MITEDYVSFDTSKLLKEKGFSSAETLMFYNSEGKCFTNQFYYNFDKNDIIDCPTLQMAMKWLREVHKLYIIVRPYVTEEGILSLFEIKDIRNKDRIRNVQTKTGFNSFEEACESAIRYCLENLI